MPARRLTPQKGSPMKLRTDFHLHTSFSADSEAPMEEMIRQGISLGLTTMCFTEHMDRGVISEDDNALFEVDTPAYRETYLRLKEKYKEQIELLFGVELGIEPKHADFLKEYAAAWPFDFIIGSSHIIDGFDPYYPAYFEGRTEEAAYRRYFETICENLAAFSNVDTYGHLDYVVRYGPNRDRYYSYEKYRDVIDPALSMMIEKGVGLEINSAGYKYGLSTTNPCPDVLRAYRRLGGEIVTVGSDAHSPRWIADHFDAIAERLQDCGYKYYAIFRQRKPEFIKL